MRCLWLNVPSSGKGTSVSLPFRACNSLTHSFGAAKPDTGGGQQHGHGALGQSTSSTPSLMDLGSHCWDDAASWFKAPTLLVWTAVCQRYQPRSCWASGAACAIFWSHCGFSESWVLEALADEELVPMEMPALLQGPQDERFRHSFHHPRTSYLTSGMSQRSLHLQLPNHTRHWFSALQ